MALALELRVGGFLQDPDEVLQRWQIADFQRGDDIYQSVTLDGVRTEQPGIKKEGDVYHIATGKSSIQIKYDIQASELPKQLHRFSRTLADAIFGNAALAHHFEHCLLLSDNKAREEWLGANGVMAYERE
jgi:hypothetical protein